MNPETSTLGGVCAAHMLDTKWLLAPSQRTGHQWIETLVRNGQSVVNLRPTTVIRLALDLIGSELAKLGLTFISGDVGALIVDASWCHLAPNGYLGQLQPSADLSSAIHESLISIRLAGRRTRKMEVAQLENAAKAKDLIILLNAYEEFLKSNALVDRADVLRRAVARLRADSNLLDGQTLILVPRGFRAGGLEREFLDSVPSGRRVEINHPRDPGDSNHSDISRLTGIGKPLVNAPQPKDDRSVHFFRAIGEVNEIREVLRRCIADEIRFDDVEVLHTDAETYIPLIYATARRFFAEPDRLEGIPVTFAEGIPVSMSRPGRALALWLRWIAEDYPQRLFVEMIGEGLLDCGEEDDLSFSYLVQIFRPISIGLGADNYLPKLNEQINALKRSLPGLFDAKEENADEDAARSRKLRGLEFVRSLVKRILPISKDVASNSGLAILEAAEKFLTKSARSVNELDNNAAEVLVQQIKSRRLWLGRLKVTLDLRKWLSVLPSQLRVLGSRPRPGHLHVANVASGGHSDRRNTFVVGLNDGRFPGATLQDPILLDTERSRLSPELSTSAARMHHKLDELANILSRLRGSLTLSWPCYDLSGDRETFASSIVLTAYRLVSGLHDADLESLNRAVGPPSSFAPTAAKQSLDETEHWLCQLSSNELRGMNRLPQVEARFGHLARGGDAFRRRADGFGPFNGFVPQAGKDLDPFAADGPVVSASALETAGRCPLAFFFRSALKLSPLDELEIDPERWVNPSQFGLLLHDVFRRFMVEVNDAGMRPQFERDHKRLAEILNEAVQFWRGNVPPPNENAYRMQMVQLIRTARIFLQTEEEFCQTSQPRFFEVALGVQRVAGGTVLDDKEPATVTVSGGKSIRARGQIDRIDEEGANQYSVWDYKVGSGYGYDRIDPFRKGRRVQSILYLRMIENALRDKLEPTASVEHFGYFFPGIRSHGLRIQWDASILAPGIAILDSLCSTIAEGAFPATDDKADCNFCDYKSICRDIPRVTGQSKELLERRDLIPLRHFQELRRG